MRALAFLLVMLATGCSLIVEKRTTQCTTDADCRRFAPQPLCVEGICVESGLGPAGCFFGAPTTDLEHLNACSTGCIDFDNCARLGLCAEQTLPALIPRP